MSTLIITLPLRSQRQIRKALRKALREIIIDKRFLPMYEREAMSGTLGEISDLIDISAYC